ncbi:MAG: hypothetical protein KAJ10_03685 [Thermodesulfovibrionia bacterium]|nr:hypothetical protein [Thermodesulfovibrionia bacterium]
MIHTTLNKIKKHSPCKDGWEKLLKHLGKTKADDEPLPFSVIFESNGLNDALWCCRTSPEHHKEWRTLALWCARQVEHLMTDKRSKDCLIVVEKYINSEATDEELAAARAAAEDATEDAAWAAAGAAAWAAAGAAAWAATGAATGAAAWAATGAATGAAARAAAWAAARAAAWAAARAAQIDKFLEIVG